METVNQILSQGDTIELGDVQASRIERSPTGSTRLVAVYDEPTQEYVILSTRFGDGDEIDIPENAQVLAVEGGIGRSNPQCWLIIPVEAYE